MEKLKADFDSRGFHYRQEWRDRNHAIYSQWDLWNNQLVGYETIRIKRQKEKIIFGKNFEGKEVYSKDKDWGSYGFTSKTFGEAQEMFLKHFGTSSNLQNLGYPFTVETLSPSRQGIMR